MHAQILAFNKHNIAHRYHHILKLSTPNLYNVNLLQVSAFTIAVSA